MIQNLIFGVYLLISGFLGENLKAIFQHFDTSINSIGTDFNFNDKIVGKFRIKSHFLSK